jgi:hypothetical protein
MTVKCLTAEDKAEIAMLYQAKIPSEELARNYEVSKRTINRVLVEQHVNDCRFRRKRLVPHGLPIDMFDLPELKVEPAPAAAEPVKPVEAAKTEHKEAPLPELTFFENLKVLLKVIFLRNNKTNDQTAR